VVPAELREPAASAPQPAAALVDGPGPWRGVPDGIPLAIWAESADQVRDARAVGRVVAILASSPDLVRAAGALGVLVPASERSVPGAVPMPPHVRARLAKARGLPTDAVAVVHPGRPVLWAGQPVADDLLDSVLGVAAAVVATGELELIRALAWAAPCVTDAGTAQDLGLLADEAVLVAAPDELASVAAGLAADMSRSAPLSSRGRQWYEAHVDTSRIAWVVARPLGILPGGIQRLDALADELGAPTGARSRARARELVANLEGVEVRV
jgi:hypothetical protein